MVKCRHRFVTFFTIHSKGKRPWQMNKIRPKKQKPTNNWLYG